ncbi:MAG: hypothetical protein AB7D92_07255 [Sphaerochaeta sp.]
MNKKQQGFVVLLILLGGILFSSGSEYSQALGVQVGRLAGIGVSYQTWMRNVGFQVAGGFLYHQELEEGGDRLVYNIGFELQYPLVSHTVNSWLDGKLYVVGGLHHQGYQEVEASESVPPVLSSGPLTLNLGLGAGVGVETILYDHFAIGTEFVYVGMYETNSGKLDINMYPQVSLRYRF